MLYWIETRSTSHAMSVSIDRILLLGSNARTRACLDARVQAEWPVVGVAIDRRAPALSARAEALGLPVLDARRPGQRVCREALAGMDACLWIMAGYTRFLGPLMLSVPWRGVLNLHGGRLPDYRGASVVNWQIIKGEPAIGLSILWTDPGVDTGPVVARDEVPLGPDEDIAVAQARVLERFPPLLRQTLDRLEAGTLEAELQDPRLGRRWPKRRAEDGHVEWNTMSARQVHDLVRAITRPYPGAFDEPGGERRMIWRTRVVDEEGQAGPPGKTVGQTDDGHPLVAARQGVVALLDTSPAAAPARLEERA